MGPSVNKLDKILFFVDASAYKLSYRKESLQNKRMQPAFMGFFYGNLIYWPLYLLKVGHHISLYAVMGVFVLEMVLHIAYYDKVEEIGSNYYTYYNRFLYVAFCSVFIAFVLWDVYWAFTS
jgi:hypothetical protein